ncbi:MAG: Na+/H+ antiporter subunit E [Porticoccaceae bacterium]
MRHTFSLSVLLAIFWLINSGNYSPLILGFGVISTILVVYLTSRMDVVDHESQPLHLFTTQLPAYYFWLGGKIIASNIEVARHIWLGKNSISPCSRWVSLSQQTDMGKVIYANSLTLTPGTISMDLTDDQIYVHALTTGSMGDILDGEMDRRVSQLEKR